MDFELENKLQEWINSHKIGQAIDHVESKLRSCPDSGFKNILGNDLIHHKKDLAHHMESFYFESLKHYKSLNGNLLKRLFSKNLVDPKKLKSISCEMATYSISDTCNFNLFAFSNDFGLKDLDWLADFDFNTTNDFVISGWEELSDVYLDYYDSEGFEDENLESSWGLCEYLMTLRLQELFQETAKILSDKNQIWHQIPIYVFAHDSELTYRTT